MSAAPTQLGALSAFNVSNLQGEFITTAIQFFLHGLYTTLVSIAVYNMWTHKRRPARLPLIAAVLLMFVCSNIQVIEQIAYTIIQVADLGLNPKDTTILVRNIRESENIFGRINYFMSDGIVVWRAWILWQDNIRVKVLLSICIVASFAGITTDMSFLSLYLFGNNSFTPTGPRTLILIIPLMTTNIVATVLFGIKSWVYRTQVKDLLGIAKNKRTNVERILVNLTESGGIYCLFWVPMLFISLTTTDPNNLGYKITANLLPQFSAIYPVIIVILVAMEKTHLSGLTTTSRSQAAHVQVGQATTGAIRFNDPQTSGTDMELVMTEKGVPTQHAGSYVLSVGAGGDPL
ncbi:hypothetical protein GGX14DRAFT_63521 [Mycena pura]|uniref:Uncharacterized protein n=1 Tax=Mycena pura TaxID=153505 RepID=A0AAD6VMF3_9AGAR|nr:hypothetical protein GGX14DRAFT_63521 [Mycena pura]